MNCTPVLKPKRRDSRPPNRPIVKMTSSPRNWPSQMLMTMIRPTKVAMMASWLTRRDTNSAARRAKFMAKG
ncbi:hypothetical protein D3C87_1994580 [compost metagenome]